jgi:quercetin dioxygenase-like cupin family protein
MKVFDDAGSSARLRRRKSGRKAARLRSIRKSVELRSDGHEGLGGTYFENQRRISMNNLVFVLMAVSLAAALGGDEADKKAATSETSAKPMMVSFTELKWAELPQRKGMQFAVLSGDPKSGEYTQIRKVPAGTDNPLHSHSSEIKNVIISGVWYTGTDAASAKNFGPGSVVVMPGGWVHVSGCRPGSECVFYQEGKGKFDFVPAKE